MRKLLGSYPPAIDYLVSAIFIAMSIALIWSGPQNWSIIPLLVLLAVLFYKKRGKKEFWKLGEKLLFPFIGFNFVVGLIQAWVTGGEASDLWYNGIMLLLSIYFSYYKIAIEPKRIKGEEANK